jgi:hypothetical protein
VIHARDEAAFERAAATLRQAYRLGEKSGQKPAVLDRIGPEVR